MGNNTGLGAGVVMRKMLAALLGAIAELPDALYACIEFAREASCYREERERERPVYTLNREMRQRIAQLELERIAQLEMELINAREEARQLRAESEAACSDAPEWAKTWRRAWRTLKSEQRKNVVERRKLHEQIEELKAELKKTRANGNA